MIRNHRIPSRKDRMDITRPARHHALAAAALAVLLAGCAGKQSPENAAVEIKGSAPASSATPAPATVPEAVAGVADASGIVSYDGYQAAIARDGDTVASVAGRVGLSASELAQYNGLPADHPLRAGDELVLPDRPGGYGSGTATQSGYQVAEATAGGQYDTSAQASAIEAAPLDGTVPTAPADTTAAAAPAEWSPAVAAAAIERSQSFDDQGNLAQPPSAGEPLPPDPKQPGQLASPNLRQYQTPSGAPATGEQPIPLVVPQPVPLPAAEPGLQSAAQPSPQPSPQPRPVETISTPAEQPVEAEPAPEPDTQVAVAAETTAPLPSDDLRLIRPVSGPVVIGFNQGAGRAKNDGIDFASPAGSPVIAAAAGEVALVSQSLGGLGTIVLLRHHDEFLTVYGRIDGVSVKKGDLVQQGQQIGTVASSTQPRMHFEVRKGAESLDPERFF